MTLSSSLSRGWECRQNLRFHHLTLASGHLLTVAIPSVVSAPKPTANQSVDVLEIIAAVTAAGGSIPMILNNTARAPSVVPTPPEMMEPTPANKLSMNTPT